MLIAIDRNSVTLQCALCGDARRTLTDEVRHG
jgi:hypothetical protein